MIRPVPAYDGGETFAQIPSLMRAGRARTLELWHVANQRIITSDERVGMLCFPDRGGFCEISIKNASTPRIFRTGQSNVKLTDFVAADLLKAHLLDDTRSRRTVNAFRAPGMPFSMRKANCIAAAERRQNK